MDDSGIAKGINHVERHDDEKKRGGMYGVGV